jgi:hypothetical protein
VVTVVWLHHTSVAVNLKVCTFFSSSPQIIRQRWLLFLYCMREENSLWRLGL